MGAAEIRDGRGGRSGLGSIDVFDMGRQLGGDAEFCQRRDLRGGGGASGGASVFRERPDSGALQRHRRGGGQLWDAGERRNGDRELAPAELRGRQHHVHGGRRRRGGACDAQGATGSIDYAQLDSGGRAGAPGHRGVSEQQHDARVGFGRARLSGDHGKWRLQLGHVHSAGVEERDGERARGGHGGNGDGQRHADDQRLRCGEQPDCDCQGAGGQPDRVAGGVAAAVHENRAAGCLGDAGSGGAGGIPGVAGSAAFGRYRGHR